MRPTIKEVKEVAKKQYSESPIYRFIYRFFSVRITRYLVGTRLTPNQITIISFFMGLLSAFLFSFGSPLYLRTGAIFLFLCIVLDCVDGEVARFKHMESKFGEFLDGFTGPCKDFFVVLGLSLGLYKQIHNISAWIWGFFVLFTMTMLNNVLSLTRAALSHSATRKIAVSVQANLRKKIKRIFKLNIEPAYLIFGGDTVGLIIILGTLLNQILPAFLAIIILGNIFWIVELFVFWGRRSTGPGKRIQK